MAPRVAYRDPNVSNKRPPVMVIVAVALWVLIPVVAFAMHNSSHSSSAAEAPSAPAPSDATADLGSDTLTDDPGVPSTDTTVIDGPAVDTPRPMPLDTTDPMPPTSQADVSTTAPTARPAPPTTMRPSPITSSAVSPTTRPAPATTAAPAVTSPALPQGPFSVNDNVAGTGLNQIQYTGSWAVITGAGMYQNDSHSSDQLGASYSMSFNGTAVSLFGGKDPAYGKAAVRVDSFPSVTVDFFAAGHANDVEVFRRGGLASGSHRITVTVLRSNSSGGAGYAVTLDRFVVTP